MLWLVPRSFWVCRMRGESTGHTLITDPFLHKQPLQDRAAVWPHLGHRPRAPRLPCLRRVRPLAQDLHARASRRERDEHDRLPPRGLVGGRAARAAGVHTTWCWWPSGADSAKVRSWSSNVIIAQHNERSLYAYTRRFLSYQRHAFGSDNISTQSPTFYNIHSQI